MDNITLWILFMIVDLSMVLIAYRFFGKNGLYAMIVMSIIVANIQVLKTVNMFGLVVTLGNVIYGSIFFSTDLLSEFHGRKAATTGVWIGFFAMILTTVYLQIALLFTPDVSDFAHPLLEGLFSFLPRIAIGSLIAYAISQMHDVWSFHFWKRFTKGKHLWLRNNASTLISQFIDSVVFSTIAFLGVFPLDVFWQILLTTYLFKLIVAVVDTPFMYYAKYVVGKKDD
ncbi:MAG: queuosine precursor transporter [Nanoarchaeota archaeon]|nr:queuosine precursor transporter [Nanoarchaeota archaeon]MBU1704118.1 queuosine precursor transporter [Nanoarchaeota archaeon]